MGVTGQTHETHAAGVPESESALEPTGAPQMPGVPDVFAGREERDTAVAFLAGALGQGSVVHAYLLVGPPASGKEDVALRFAAALVADGDAGEFDTARRLAHPDVHIFEPDGVAGYKVAGIRELVADAAKSPVRSACKAYIVNAADTLNDSSANALLKTLEEPSADTVLILLAPTEGSVLETVRSRCEVLTLAGTDIRPDADAEVFSAMRDVATGCGDRALLAHARRISERAKGGGDDITRERAEELERVADFLSASATKDHDERTSTLVRAAQADELLRLVDAAAAWLREVLLVSLGAPEMCAHPSESAVVMQVATQAPPDGAVRALEAVGECRTRLACNVSGQLAVEAMLLEVRSALVR